jgi:hypothetical protein
MPPREVVPSSAKELGSRKETVAVDGSASFDIYNRLFCSPSFTVVVCIIAINGHDFLIIPQFSSVPRSACDEECFLDTLWSLYFVPLPVSSFLPAVIF